MSDKGELLRKISQSSFITHTSHINLKNHSNHLPFTLKPLKFHFAKDIDLNSMYELMIKETNNFSNRIEINHLMKHNRRKIIIKIKEFIVQNRLSKTLIFNAIFYLDVLLSSNTMINIDKLGIGALILSIKFNELNNKNPYMREYRFIYGNYFNFYDNELIQIEMICLKKLNYFLNHIQPIHFLQILLINGIVFSSDNNKAVSNNINLNIYNLPYQILEIAMENIDYNNYYPLHIACSCIAITREINHLDKWNEYLERISQIKFINFERPYAFVKLYQ